MRSRFISAILAALACGAFIDTAQTAARSTPDMAAVDAVFASYTSATPGCAVGAAVGGRPVLARAYGMADLEHDVPNTPDTIFEAGSVSKQFTAAAVLLLAHDGKLSLDDPVRKYIPELPDYDAHGLLSVTDGTAAAGTGRITIRNLLNHTSGLRDWGSVEAIAGWPRTTRVYTHAHVLDIVSRQRALNFPPGTQWSYSNTGYNLAAILVARVSGMPFAEFTRTRIFEPLGMTHTSWRDDHTRVVKHRAMAYDEKKDGFHIDMPFEDVHGNGGLLTTVGDLLKWHENFESPVVGDAAIVAEQQRPGHFTDGRPFNYALGLFVDTYKGVREVSHSGSTTGYRAFVARFPDQHVSVAVLCNVASANATAYSNAVSDLLLGSALKPASTPAAHAPEELAAVQGLYRDDKTSGYFRVSAEQPKPGDRLVLSPGFHWAADGPGHLKVMDDFGAVARYDRVEPAHPTAGDLRAYAGAYVSDEAETMLTVAVEGDALILKQRPDKTMALTPVYADVFRTAAGPLLRFRRDAAARVVALSVIESRVWDLRFTRRDGRT